MSTIIQKIISIIIALLMATGLFPTPKPPAEGIKADAELSFANNEPGSAAGTVTVQSDLTLHIPSTGAMPIRRS